MAQEDDCFKEDFRDDLLFWLTENPTVDDDVVVVDMFDTIQGEG